MALTSPIPDQTMRNVKRYIPPQHSIQLPNRPQNRKIMVAVMNHPRKPAALSWTSVLSSGDSVFKMLSCCFPGTLVKSGQANHSHLFQGTSASKIIHFIQYYPLMLLSPQEKKNKPVCSKGNLEFCGKCSGVIWIHHPLAYFKYWPTSSMMEQAGTSSKISAEISLSDVSCSELNCFSPF